MATLAACVTRLMLVAASRVSALPRRLQIAPRTTGRASSKPAHRVLQALAYSCSESTGKKFFSTEEDFFPLRGCCCFSTEETFPLKIFFFPH